MVRGSSFTSGFYVDETMQAFWFGFMEEIVHNGYNFELYALFDIEPMKRSECWRDVCMLSGVGDGASECIMD